jgi:hypothetical protein
MARALRIALAILPALLTAFGPPGAFAADAPRPATDPLNAIEFGADPSGATSSSAALQRALQAALASHRPLRIPPGAYLVTSPVVLEGDAAGNTNGISVFSDAPAPLFYSHLPRDKSAFAALIVGPRWPAGRAILEFRNVGRITLRNLWFVGNGSGRRDQTDATSVGVHISGRSADEPGTAGHRIEGCTFQLHQIGLDLSGLYRAEPGDYLGSHFVGYSHVVENVFTNNWKAGAWLNGGDTQFIGNYFNESHPGDTTTDMVGVGLLVMKGLNVVVTGGKIEWCSKGIALYNAGAFAMTGVMTDRNTFGVMVLANGGRAEGAGRGIAITGNRFLASLKHHLYFANVAGDKFTGAISGNTFAKGSQSAYDENDGHEFAPRQGPIGPIDDIMYFGGTGAHVFAIVGNSMEAGSAEDLPRLRLGGGAGTHFTVKANAGRFVPTGADLNGAAGRVGVELDRVARAVFDASQHEGESLPITARQNVRALAKAGPAPGRGWTLYFDPPFPDGRLSAQYSGSAPGFIRVSRADGGSLSFDLVGPDGRTAIAPTDATVTVTW